jgi:hypothetical protein
MAIASPLTPDQAISFLQCLLDHPESADEFVCERDLAITNRLGIDYLEAPSKALISWDIPVQQRDRLRQDKLATRLSIQKLDERHSLLELTPGDDLLEKRWIFRDGKLTSSILYKVRSWKQVDSAHFRFFISDDSTFHPANITALESFLTETASLLGFSDADMDRLAKEKIYYCFCSSEEEIQDLTGFVARGMYILSHDIIVSTYSAHLHELAHLLINYKLQRPHLYTHPMLLEGFAVTVGGRGGKVPSILGQLGLFLHRSGWIAMDDLLDTQGFRRENASLSYPASATYNRFLLESLGPADYLELYGRHGGDEFAIVNLEIPQAELPSDEGWQRFLSAQGNEGAIGSGAGGLNLVGEPVAFHPLPGGEHYGFSVPTLTLATEGESPAEYRSFLFEELVNDHPYRGERFLIRASSEEVGIYDLFTNTMIAHYSLAFSESAKAIPIHDDRYLFHVDRSLFPEGIANAQCRFPVD